MNYIPYKDRDQNTEKSLKPFRKEIYDLLSPKESTDNIDIPEIIIIYCERILISSQKAEIVAITETLLDILNDLSPDSEIQVFILNYLFQILLIELRRNISNYQAIWRIFIALNRFKCFYEYINRNQLNLYELANFKELISIDHQYIVSTNFGLLLQDDSILIDHALTYETFQFYAGLLKRRDESLQNLYHRIIENTSIISNRSNCISSQNEEDFIFEIVTLVFEPILLFTMNFPSNNEYIFLIISILDGILTKGFDLMSLYEFENPLLIQMINASLESTNDKELFNTLSVIDKILIIRNPDDALAFFDNVNCCAIINLFGPEIDEIQSILIHILTVLFALDNIKILNSYHLMFQAEKGIINNILYRFDEYPICTKHDIINVLSQLTVQFEEIIDSEILEKISNFLSVRMNEKDLIILYDILNKLIQQYPEQQSLIATQISQEFWQSIQEEFPDASNSFNKLMMNN